MVSETLWLAEMRLKGFETVMKHKDIMWSGMYT